MAIPFWRGAAPLLLASGSPVRRTLLEAAGLPVDTEIAGIDERALEADLAGRPPAEIATALACAKAEAVSLRHPHRLVVGADQVLDLDGAVRSKAADRAAAARQLTELSGRRHALHAAAALARGGRVETAFHGTAWLTMRALGAEAIEHYLALAGAAATRSVGGYEAEALGIQLFEAIEGEQAVVLGLPLLQLLAALRSRDLLAF